MVPSTARSRTEIRLHPAPILLVTTVAGLVLAILAELKVGAGVRFQLHLLALGIYGLALVAWLSEAVRPGLGVWCIAAGLIGVINVSHNLFRTPGLFTLVVIPMVILLAANGPKAALVIAGGATIALFANQAKSSVATGEVVVALIALWSSFLTLAAFYIQVAQVDHWLAEYLERARTLVDESRDRKAELAQALDDVTHLNRQMALMTQRQAALRQVAEQAAKAKVDFVARVSHEFRTPLNIIIGMIDLMVETPNVRARGMSDEAMAHLQIVHRNCQHLASMIDDVLDLSRVEAERVSLQRAWVDMRQLVSTATRVVEPLIQKKGLLLTVDCPDDLPLIYCDRIRIRQVLLNLLSNAARATDRGSIVLRLEAQLDVLLLSVSDTGPGIPSDLIDIIFEPFVQSAGPPTDGTERGGSGLGLSISKQFVEMHGGRMWVDSELGKGTTFFVELLLRSQQDQPSHPGHPIREEWIWLERRSRPQPSATQFRPRVVLSDATGSLVPSLSHLTDSIEFLGTPDLASAIEEARRFPVSALIVNEISLSGLSRAMDTATQAAPGIPVIGWSCAPPLERALQGGARGYLVKPIRRTDLERVVGSLQPRVRRLLLVEDDADTREMMRMMLQMVDDSIQVVSVGTSAEALLQMRSERPDLALVDIVLPDMNGWQLLAQMRDDEALQSIPTVVVSGQDLPDEAIGSRWLFSGMRTPMPLNRLLESSIRLMEMLSLASQP